MATNNTSLTLKEREFNILTTPVVREVVPFNLLEAIHLFLKDGASMGFTMWKKLNGAIDQFPQLTKAELQTKILNAEIKEGEVNWELLAHLTQWEQCGQHAALKDLNFEPEQEVWSETKVV
ncbi:hypothetical protein G7Y89_g12202 [Cudoniella acicularis]|uniref:Uncharacterized protein n=1 Tax=Cudoniella acicularis TaxID=354080 RepID=A0A8H4VX91_9HELO|nr:hypothetical protein G7Y89_g12202 [Cudoniella acicularis]